MKQINNDADEMQISATKVVKSLSKNRHHSGSKTRECLLSVYTNESISRISKELFFSLNNRKKYIPYYSECKLPQIFNKYEDYKSFCIKLFEQDLRSPSNDIYHRLLLQFNICQYCHVESASALDHYFDKNNSPELAIIPDNLIPICTQCNSKKNKKSLSFPYPYLLLLSTPDWLICTVNADTSFKFSVCQTAATTQFETQILEDLNSVLIARNVFMGYVTRGQAHVTDRISQIRTAKKRGEKRDTVKQRIAVQNKDTYDVYLKSTEFYQIAINNGIIKNFDEIWENL